MFVVSNSALRFYSNKEGYRNNFIGRSQTTIAITAFSYSELFETPFRINHSVSSI